VGVGVVVRDGRVEISVTDQGVGISAQELDRVFERFYRGDPARSRQTGGTGLGLSIVKHVVHNHRGEVRVWSHPGRGSTFTIKLATTEPEANQGSGVEAATVVESKKAGANKARPSEFVATTPQEQDTPTKGRERTSA
jgi:two-component system sensor histidine kinase SenX3